MLDHYVHGSVERMSPEAPIPVLTQKNEDHRLGGAGNVAMNLKSLGARVKLFSVVGEDEPGRQITSLMEANQLGIEFLIIDPSRPTTIKNRVMEGSRQLLRIDHEDNSEIKNLLQAQIIERLLKEIPDSDALIFQDYDKGVISEGLIKEVVRGCKAASVPVIVDPKMRNFSSYQGVSLFKPNQKELEASLGKAINTEDLEELIGAYQVLRGQIGFENLLVTLSEKGIFVANDEEQRLIPTTPATSPDVSGAGDTVAAVAALGYVAGLSLVEIGQWANLAGRIVCQSPGVVPVSRDLLLDQLEKIRD